jgi:transposase
MKLDKISVNETISKARSLLEQEKSLSFAIKAVIELLILLIQTFARARNITSSNSSKPPSEDKYRKRGSCQKKSRKNPGGQPGHDGHRLKKFETPDEIKEIKIDFRKLPKGNYREAGYEARQVVDFQIDRIITEYRAEKVEDEKGKRYTAKFPEYAQRDVQYGHTVKSHAVYLSQYQFIPYARIQSYFEEKIIPVCTGSIFNFNREAYLLLEDFEKLVKEQLLKEKVLNADETGIHVNKQGVWLHSISSRLWSYFYPHAKRGCEAMDEVGILPNFKGTLVHDHWKPYYRYDCSHSLCNAHHLRELKYAFEEEKQLWASDMKKLLIEMNDTVNKTAKGKLSKKASEIFRLKYDKIIRAGLKECPLPEAGGKPKRGRIKKSKSRNLLERLRDFKEDTLRFMDDPLVSFTNNSGENDLRMTKVQQKISGCFRSMEGAQIFCRIRSYLLTCQKHDVPITEALDLLFQGKMPVFISDLINAS